MAVYELNGVVPHVADTAWVANSAEVIGQVDIGEEASVWYASVVRGDMDAIRIGARSNIQDGCVLHADKDQPLTIGCDVTVGHRVMLHGCTIGDGSLIGIGAIVLNGAVIGKGCLVGAGSLVTQGKVFPDGAMIMGSPARVVRQQSPEQVAELLQSAEHYVKNARGHQANLHQIS